MDTTDIDRILVDVDGTVCRNLPRVYRNRVAYVPASPNVRMAGPLLVVCCGLPGVGKSTVSAYITEQRSATRYRTDELRHELFETPSYTTAEGRATYEELFDRTEERLEGETDVVVDGTFKYARERDRAAQLGEEHGATVRFVRVTCPPAVVCERIQSRTDDASDADVSVYQSHRDQFEPLAREHVTVDNSGDLDDTYRQIDRTVLGGPV
jgi:predicted kinase